MHRLKNTNYTNASNECCTCAEKYRKSSSWLGNSVRWFVVHEHVNIHILLSLFVGLCIYTNVWKVSSANRVCYYRWFVEAHSPVCSTLRIAQKVSEFFLWCGKVGGCLGVWWSMFQEVVWGFREGRGELSSGLSQPGGNSCWAVWWSGLWCSITVFLMVGAGRWVGSFTILFTLLEHRARKMCRVEGKEARMIFAAVFTVRWRVLRSAALQFPYQTVKKLVCTLSLVPL